MEFLNNLAELIPAGVLVALLGVVLMTEATKTALSILEDYLEAKVKRQIKFFEHTKIVFCIFWSMVFTAFLAWGEIIQTKTAPLYLFVLIGASSVLYELIIKRLKKLAGSDD